MSSNSTSDIASSDLDHLCRGNSVICLLARMDGRMFLEFEQEERRKVAEKLLASAASMNLWRTGRLRLSLRVTKCEGAPRAIAISTQERCRYRAGAGVHELLALPHQAFPTRTFQLIREPALAATIRAEVSCITGKFTLALESMPRGLCSVEVREALRSHAQRQRTDITLNAHMHPFAAVHFPGPCKHGGCLEATNADLLLQGCRRLVHTSSAPRKVIKMTKRTKEQRKGAGGTWRAFHKVHGSGSGLPNSAKVAAAYHSMRQAPSTELDSLKTLGQSLTVAARLPARCRNALLSTAKTGMRRRQQVAIQSLWGNVKGRSTSDVAAAILGETKRIGRGFVTMLTMLYLGQLHLKLSHSVQDRKPLHQKPANVAGMAEHPRAEFRYVSEPDAKATAERGKMVAAYATEHANHPLGKCLTGLWEILHQLQEAKPKPMGVPKGEKKGDCLLAGRCLCSGGGKHLQKLRDQLHSVLKSVCAGPDKSLITGGKIVLHIANAEGSSDWDEEQTDELHYLFGVAMMYFKLYRATLERLKPSSFVEPCLVDPPPNLRHVTAWATTDFLSELAALDLLDLAQTWHLQAYRLLESETPVLDMRLLHLAVKPVGAGSHLRPPTRRP
eukprot:2201931-Amphidinium_carterae.1